MVGVVGYWLVSFVCFGMWGFVFLGIGFIWFVGLDGW